MPTERRQHALAGNPWLVLATVMVGTLLIGLDRTVVNLAVPKVISDFGITVSTAAWIATAYIITNAVFVPVFGKLGDLFGNRAIYLWSFVGFIVVSVLAGLAWSFDSLIAFRALQGLVGAAVYPTAMSLIAKSFKDPKARSQALGIWSSSFAVSAIIGPLLGGYLIDHFSWRMIFYINLPIGIAGLAMTMIFLPHDAPTDRGRFDWFGSILLAGAITSMVLVLDQGQSWGWTSNLSLACYASTIIFGFLTYWWETNHTHPIIDFKLFQNPVIVSVLAVSFISFGGMMGAMFLLPVFTQTFLGYDAIKTGLLFVPMGLSLPIFAPLGARLAQTIPARYTVSFGMFVAALSFFLLRNLDPAMTYFDFVIPLILFGAGLGLGMAPLTTASTTAVPTHEIGMSSALLNLTRNIGGAFGIAIFGTILANATNANVLKIAQHSVINSTNPRDIAIGTQLIILKADLMAYSTVFAAASLAMVIGGVLALILLRSTGSAANLTAEQRAEAMAGGSSMKSAKTQSILKELPLLFFKTKLLIRAKLPHTHDPNEWMRCEILRFIQSNSIAPTMQDVAAFLRVKAPSVTSIIIRLERERLVMRVRERTDRRVVHITLTQKGLSRLNKYEAEASYAMKKVFSKMSAKQLESFARILRSL